ncbi:MAG: diaminopimelate epimerase [Eubacterium sp.]|nr:diaminopimelate epimerase [Eubacterium sp.]
MKFTKMQGCGNDYVYINGFVYDIKDPNALSIKVSDRHFGIGSDGLVIINPSDIADFKMNIYNADGSEAMMCGNGIRCVGKYVYDNKMTNKTHITVETLSGIKELDLNVEGDKVKSVRVNMGEPILEPEKIPVKSDKKYIVGDVLRIAGKRHNITCLSVGNPHCVTFTKDVSKINIEKLGPMFEHHEMFPDRVNTEFIEIVDKQHIKMRVWERGSGETMACGTGATASVVACALNGLTGSDVYVELIGGTLYIEYDRNANVIYMTGPCEVQFEGEFED